MQWNLEILPTLVWRYFFGFLNAGVPNVCMWWGMYIWAVNFLLSKTETDIVLERDGALFLARSKSLSVTVFVIFAKIFIQCILIIRALSFVTTGTWLSEFLSYVILAFLKIHYISIIQLCILIYKQIMNI